MKISNFFKNIILISFLILINSFMIIYYISIRIYPYIVITSEKETRNIISYIINSSMDNDNINYSLNNLYNIKYNNNGEIIFIDLNYKDYNYILDSISNSIKTNLNKINSCIMDFHQFNYISKDNLFNNDIILEVPIVLKDKFYLLSNIIPRIPIKIVFTANSSSNFFVDLEDYGINNALIKVYVDIKVSAKIIVPFLDSNDIIVENRIPLSFRIVNGKVPSYYID